MGLKKALSLALFVLLLIFPLTALAQSRLLSVDIEQTDVKMPRLKVYLNLNGQDGERLAETDDDAAIYRHAGRRGDGGRFLPGALKTAAKALPPFT